MEPTLSRSKPWNLPFWFMLGIMIVTSLQSLILFRTVAGYHNRIPGSIIFFALMWPVVLLIEAVVYRLLRKRITERKWVWAHLLFSLFGFVLLAFFRVIVYALISYNFQDSGRDKIYLVNKIDFYSYWCCVVIGHIFFIVAIVRSLSRNNSVASQEANDFLNEL